MTVAVRKMDRIYALYKGDEYICDGTITEIASKTGKTRNTLYWMTSNTYKKRISRGKNRLQMVELDEGE
ncbi:hypothetical protein [Convivina praedatoris]|uniref:hypothetical protein n=1 Tax=Convivina praedatoris TaxID=2880963 RepID=UPI00200DBA4B|nr:hypothetical protein [Convivina sp. LMG 32447]CAH1857247.1 hypothetical protein R077815_01555 [Convivina sp. LMG 32447]